MPVFSLLRPQYIVVRSNSRHSSSVLRVLTVEALLKRPELSAFLYIGLSTDEILRTKSPIRAPADCIPVRWGGLCILRRKCAQKVQSS